ncbi:hypothetical protein MRX96_034976 [Rhipicephalus microplus]
MGSSTLEYTGLITADPVARLLHIPPHWGSRLTILTNRIPGICRKGHTPRAALLQETCALIEEWYSDHLHVYTDGSGNKDGSVNSIILALRVERKCRLLLRASSTSAELTALNLVAHQLAEILPPSTVVFSDSRAMLLTLARGDRGSSIAQRLTCKFTVVVRSGGGCVVPELIGVLVHSSSVFTLDAAEPRPGSSDSVAVTSLRVCSVRQKKQLNISCVSALDTWIFNAKTIARLFNAYAQLGLPHVSSEQLLLLRANVATLRRAFHELLDFFGDADLIKRL